MLQLLPHNPLKCELDKKAILWPVLLGVPFAGLSAYDTYKNYKAMRAAKAAGDPETARRNRNWMLINAALGAASIPTAGLATAIGRVGLARLAAGGGKAAEAAAAKLAMAPAAVTSGSEVPYWFGTNKAMGPRAAGALQGFKSTWQKAWSPLDRLEMSAYRGLGSMASPEMANKLVRVGEMAEKVPGGTKLPLAVAVARGLVRYPQALAWSGPGIAAQFATPFVAPRLVGQNPVWEQQDMNDIPKASAEEADHRVGVDLAAALLGGGAGLAGNYLMGADSPLTAAATGAATGLGAAEGARALGNWVNGPYEKPPYEVPPGELIPEEAINPATEILGRMRELARPPDVAAQYSPLTPPPRFNSEIGVPYSDRTTRDASMLANAIRQGVMSTRP